MTASNYKLSAQEYFAFVAETFNGMQTLIHQKNQDYTNGAGPFSNFEQASEFGVDPLVGLAVRLGDKFKRLQSYCKSGSLAVENEGIDDIFRDFIGYSCIALGMLEERRRANEGLSIPRID